MSAAILPPTNHVTMLRVLEPVVGVALVLLIMSGVFLPVLSRQAGAKRYVSLRAPSGWISDVWLQRRR
jgi:hypothetical protein